MIQLTWVVSSVSTWPRLDLQVNYTATLCFALFWSLNMDATYQNQVLMLTQQSFYLLSHLLSPNTLLFVTTQWFNRQPTSLCKMESQAGPSVLLGHKHCYPEPQDWAAPQEKHCTFKRFACLFVCLSDSGGGPTLIQLGGGRSYIAVLRIFLGWTSSMSNNFKLFQGHRSHP